MNDHLRTQGMYSHSEKSKVTCLCLLAASVTEVFKVWPHQTQFSSATQSCPTLCDPMNHSTPGLPVHHQLPQFNQTRVHWVSDAFQPSHSSYPSPPVFNLFHHQDLFFTSGGRSIGTSTLASVNECSGQISFRIDWFDLLAVQGILKSFLQHHSSKASILQCSAFFMAQHSHP